MPEILAIVLGGGKGTRLYPLTQQRAKPAVPFGGKYRLVDIPISNCINSDMKQIYILTQFNSVSLHNHLARTYIFDVFSHGFVEILAAEQTFENTSWYEGTADAVRKNFPHFNVQKPTHYIILSGDQLYRMDLKEMFRTHIESKAEITIASTPVDRLAATALGILQADKKGRITRFLEKPSLDVDIEYLRIPENLHPDKEMKNAGKNYLASMGMYIFDAHILEQMLNNDKADFGKEIIPMAIESRKVQAYIFTGFWEDIGTIKNFYETNINLASLNPAFNFYDEDMPIYTHRRHLPATKINYCNFSLSLAAEGSIITDAKIDNSIIGIRTIIEPGSDLDGIITMGASEYETPEERSKNRELGRPDIGIGRGTHIRRAIIDQNCRIGDGCRIGVDEMERQDGDYGRYHIRDGIIVIPKGKIIPSGSVI
ncbi:glucose-1-phosphate adenylyltransferase [Marispirochaeta sp.]|jgi:glucose-1-phosphate adenylyltransferase|uniref:glucose-1-phosphate adenylyltransferase n=1 Tax=Marispirochaeta sp. TaxID=2038653 RepID=UPI0029C88A16|nr:glucose-1-phosphate adenylyltransferase [Marispirochaeta sp.]